MNLQILITMILRSTIWAGRQEIANNIINALAYDVNTAGLAPEQPGEAYTKSISVISESDDSFEFVREF